MRIAVIGRTKMLLDAAKSISKLGHDIPLIITSQAEAFYTVSEDEFEDFAVQNSAAFYCVNSVNKEEIQTAIRSVNCDLAISMNWPTLIGAETLGIFSHGVFNAHPGALPRYKGNACPNWAILNGEDTVGLTVHQMVTELDAGPIFFIEKLKIDEQTYIGDIYDWLGTIVPQAMVSLIEKLERGDTEGIPQSEMGVEPLRCYPRRPSDSRIDWSNSVNEIICQVRASSRPFSGAYSYLEGAEKVIIWRAEPYDDIEPFLAAPGQIAGVMNGKPVILARDGAVLLTDFSLEGSENAPMAPELLSKSLRSRLT